MAHVITLAEKKEALRWHMKCELGRKTEIAVNALRREIELEEAEEKAKLPTLTEIEAVLRSRAGPVEDWERSRRAAAEIVKLVREGFIIRGNQCWLTDGAVQQIARLS